MSAVVVEDDPAIMKLTVRALEDIGLVCKAFWDAETAIAYLSCNPVPDLLTVDIALPGMSGLHLVRELRRSTRFANARVIVLTARSDIGDAITATKLGALFFKKPFRLAEFRDAVTHALCGYTPRARVMIVDDDDGIREAVVNVISDEGLEAVEARDGIDALRLLKTQPMPELILLDIMMPGLDGVSVAEEILSYRAPPPIVLISARDDVARESRRLCVFDHLRKPVTLPEIVRVIRRATERSAARSPAL